MAQCFPAHQCIVVGGGLSGFSAAHTILEHGGRALLLDKSPFCGGNSTKATSGINGAETQTQKAKGIQDSKELFLKDTLKGGAKKPELAKVLTYESGPGVDWLIEKFELDLSLVARMGGASMPRCHRGAERFPGMTITYALMQRFEKICETSDRAKIVNKARVFDLLMNGKTVIGCEYEFKGMSYKEYGPVIFCSGGFGADFASDSLLAKHRPDLLHLPTTNGEHCTGDGIKMGVRVGAQTIDLEWVQVHPTSLVKMDEPDAKVKFLAAEALRGVGGILIDKHGKRFANELGRRDYVTGMMWKNDPPFRLCLNKASSSEIHWHVEHYKGRGVMKYFESGAALSKEMGINPDVLKQTFKEHSDIAEKVTAQPNQGPYDAYPDGKSFDPWGKKYFHNTPQIMEDEYNVAIVTPSIHYCMGGLSITEKGEVLSEAGGTIPGLYAAGEIAGGVHGNNRLGGSSLLDCVVYGRVSGRNCADWMMGKNGEFSMFPRQLTRFTHK